MASFDSEERQKPGAKVFREACWIGAAPDPLMKVSEWADKYRILAPTGSAEPGPWRTDRTPYLREIMDCLSPDSPVQEVVVMKGAQIGFTEMLVNFLGFVIDVTSGPAILVAPTVDLAKRFSKQRIDPLVDFSERIKMKVSDARTRDSGNTVLSKEFPNGILVLTGANSAVGLRSMPARFILLDETDAYPDDVDGEGSPILLAKARSRTFARRKIIEGSTPTIQGRSKIEESFENTDMRFYNVPCPDCGGFQVITWEHIKWDEGQPETAHMVCEHCGVVIEEHKKTEMLLNGKWVPTREDTSRGIRRGYHLSSLYSPVGWYSWAQAAKDFLDAKPNQEKLRSFVNTVLGQVWKSKGESPDWKRIYDRRESYRMGVVPRGGLFLVCGVDVQKDRIEAEIVAYGKERESWSVDYMVFQGDTAKPDAECWQKLDQLLEYSFEHEAGIVMPIRIMAVDSGYNTQVVYNWCRKHPANRVLATKGSESCPTLLGAPSAVDIKLREGAKIRRGFKVWPVGVNIAKTELYGWLKLDTPLDGHGFPAGFCHFPQYGEEFFKQLTAEQTVVRRIRGYARTIWEKTRERNEALDCRVLARAAACAFGMDRMKREHWEHLEKTMLGKTPQETRRRPEGEAATSKLASKVEDKSAKTPTTQGIVRRKSSYL